MIWKKINGYNDYMVSNTGEVKSIKFNKELLLSPANRKDGYLMVQLRGKGKSKGFLVHRLVCIAFNKYIKDKHEVNHIDGDKKNNHISNLEWSNRSENLLHAFKNGLKSMKGECHSKNILNEKSVLEIRKKYIPRKYTIKILSDEYNVSIHAISDVIYKKSWKHI